MVSKFCFELDKKGILPFWFEDERTYLKRGEDLIKKYDHFDLEDAFRKTKIRYKMLSKDESCGLIGQEKIKKGAESVLAEYGYDLSWIKGVYFEHRGFSLSRPISGIGGWFECGFPRHGNYDGYSLPFISINAKLGGKNKTITHELVHAARPGICLETTIEKDSIKHMDDKAKKKHILKVQSYEEAFAESVGSFTTLNSKGITLDLSMFSLNKHKRLIKKAKKTLKEHLGESAGYVLGRLTYDETKDIVDSNPIAFIDREAKKPYGSGLRLQIIKEKLEKG